MSSFYSQEELKQLEFLSLGENVLISKKSSIYSSDQISIGNNVRIDDFCILSGKIKIGNYIHIAAYSALYGGSAGIFINDFSNISSKNCIYATSDDFSGETMTNPMIPNEFKNIKSLPVEIEKHVLIGSGCVVLPGVVLKEGSTFGAMSLINKTSSEWTINAGIPYKKLKNRSKKILTLEQDFLKQRVGDING